MQKIEQPCAVDDLFADAGAYGEHREAQPFPWGCRNEGAEVGHELLPDRRRLPRIGQCDGATASSPQDNYGGAGDDDAYGESYEKAFVDVSPRRDPPSAESGFGDLQIGRVETRE